MAKYLEIMLEYVPIIANYQGKPNWVKLEYSSNASQNITEPKNIYSFVSGAPGDENKSHAGGCKNIFFGKCHEIRTLKNQKFYLCFGSQ